MFVRAPQMIWCLIYTTQKSWDNMVRNDRWITIHFFLNHLGLYAYAQITQHAREEALISGKGKRRNKGDGFTDLAVKFSTTVGVTGDDQIQ